MATLDGLTLHGSVLELQSKLTGGRIDKINQPEHDEIQILIRSSGINYRLLICACPDTCRIQITDTKKPNPVDAPMFCMLLRKHLSGGRITAITQPCTDRIVRLSVESTDELYNTGHYTLVCELMGRHSNIILLDSEGIIMESSKRIGLSVSKARVIMPGIPYELPPTEQKKDPLEACRQEILNVLSAAGRADKLLSSAFYGTAPCVAAQMLQKAGEDIPAYTQDMTDSQKARVADTVYEIFFSIKNGSSKPCIQSTGDKKQFLPFSPCKGAAFTEYHSAGEMLDAYYTERDKHEFMRRRSYSLLHAVETKLQRAQKKLAAFDEAIVSESDYDKYRVYGELVTANMYKIRSGQNELIAENYYENPVREVVIPLDSSLSSVRNAQKYFKLYKKAKGARDNALAMRESVQNEIEYLIGVRTQIQNAFSTEELEEIRSELEELKFIRREQKAKRKKAVKKSMPSRFISSDGYEIYVGRNNYQNDFLTFKIASANDMWLHVKDRPGSHTVIINKDKAVSIPDSTLYEAAVLAAFYSSAGTGAKAEVDYTLCRYVKKPSGALPGKVIYTNQRTLLAVADKGALIEELPQGR